jgi:hypothetical protein
MRYRQGSCRAHTPWSLLCDVLYATRDVVVTAAADDQRAHGKWAWFEPEAAEGSMGTAGGRNKVGRQKQGRAADEEQCGIAARYTRGEG